MHRLLSLFVASLLALVALPPAVVTAAPGQGDRWNPPAEVNRDLPPGLVAYHEIAPRLRDIATRSNRVQVEVIGQSAQGRDLYLVTVSDPSAFGRLGRYQALRRLMLRDPAEAQRRAAEFGDFKVPVFVNGSIHGNEWEGVDASLALIERLAFANDAETRAVLDNTILLFNVVQNPDGRVLGQRRNANGFDLNRDFITQSQPETRATVEQLVKWNPMVLLDLHGYVNPMLIEPATPPHNPNYEYDLYLKWALDQAEAMETSLRAETGLPATIPFRDWEDGWDDWPPIFTPMYAMYHGSYGSTLEAPMRVNNSAVNLPAEERRQRAATNVAAHVSAVWGALRFASEHRLDMVSDQIEIFRRGFLAEPQRSIREAYGEQHDFVAEFPEAYVIPAGAQQTSALAAARLVNFLAANDVQVERATRPFAVDSQTYPAGSYVVPLAQPKRGLANTILEAGFDITEIVPVMYDISGWSHSLLWGATVVSVPAGTNLEAQTSPVQSEQRVSGAVGSGRAAAYALVLDDPAAIRAANALLASGIVLERATSGFDGFPAGTLLAPAAAKAQLQRVANEEGVVFAAIAALPAGRAPLAALRLAAAAADDDVFALREMGFAVDRVSTAALNAGASLAGYDVLFVSSGLDYSALDAAARADLGAFLARGGGVVTRGVRGARFNQETALLDVEPVEGPRRANGVARVENAAGSPIVPGTAADAHTFVYSPLWFTRVGPGVAVDQRFADGDFFVAGHWIGQEEAAGQPVVVHGVDESGARAVLFGTEPLFRAHPKGLYRQVANALYWAAG